MRVLVTGGCSFLGASFIEYEYELYDDIQVLNIDALIPPGKKSNNAAVEKQTSYYFKQIDIRNLKALKIVFDDFNPEYIIHFAAQSHVDKSIVSPEIFLDTNVVGTFNVLEAWRQSNVKYFKKFIHISTDEVFGPILKGSANEDSPFNPTNPYSASKAAAESLIKAYRHTYKLPVNIVRCVNNFGKYQDPTKFIPKAIISLLSNERIPIYGEGRQIREWIYARDNADRIDRVLRDINAGLDYNLSTGFELQNIALAKFLCKKLDKNPKDYIVHVADRISHDVRYSMTSLMPGKGTVNVTSEAPEITDFEEAMEMTIDWYKVQYDKASEEILKEQ